MLHNGRLIEQQINLQQQQYRQTVIDDYYSVLFMSSHWALQDSILIPKRAYATFNFL